jgi:hypothetical protein
VRSYAAEPSLDRYRNESGAGSSRPGPTAGHRQGSGSSRGRSATRRVARTFNAARDTGQASSIRDHDSPGRGRSPEAEPAGTSARVDERERGGAAEYVAAGERTPRGARVTPH